MILNPRTFQISLAALAWLVVAHVAAAQSASLWTGSGGNVKAAKAWSSATANAKVRLPLLHGEELEGIVQRVVRNTDATVISGKLDADPRGTFFASSTRAKGLHGLILLPGRRTASRISGTTENPKVEELPISNVVCFGMPRPRNEITSIAKPANAPGTVPILNSRPDATAVLYIDFNGEVVIDPAWNGGARIDAQTSGMNADQITEVWQRVSEDYRPFNVNVTTDVARYNSAALGQRVRCIVTPTDSWFPDFVGGVAFVGSFADDGTTYSTTIPCWVFITNSAKDCAEAVSHELGHTLGLMHDGTTPPLSDEYYGGHGAGQLGWAPIMGVGYYEEMTQWSKGEYPFANNTEDDLEIISGPENAFGYAPADAGDSIATALPVPVSNGKFAVDGLIEKTGGTDYYRVNVNRAGMFSVGASTSAMGGNLAASVTLMRQSGAIIGSSLQGDSPDPVFMAYVVPGTYYVAVSGIGHPASGVDYGFSNYASLGSYHLYAGTQILKYQPDIVMGQPAHKTGQLQFGKTPQRLALKIKGTRPIRVPMTIVNFGVKSDRFHILSGSLPGNTYRIFFGKHDVTEAIRFGNFNTPVVAPSKSLALTLMIYPSSTTNSKNLIKLRAISCFDNSKFDLVDIQLQPPRTRHK